jgi:hypothetical protein
MGRGIAFSISPRRDSPGHTAENPASSGTCFRTPPSRAPRIRRVAIGVCERSVRWRRRDLCPRPRRTLSRVFSERNEAAVEEESSSPAARRSRRLQHVSMNRVDLRAVEETRADSRNRSKRQYVNRLRPQLAHRQRVEKLPKKSQFRVRLPPARSASAWGLASPGRLPPPPNPLSSDL